MRRAVPARPGEIAALLGLLAWQACAGTLARRNYERLPLLDASGSMVPPDTQVNDTAARAYADTQRASLAVSVIVPARNEAANLPPLLASLAAQERAPEQIIVVDDRSTDETPAIATTAGATLVRSEGPPAGWTGKTFACHLGAARASQAWLLFLDADTTLAPKAIATALAFAQAHELDGLSLFLQQACKTFWERLLLPYAYAQYFAGMRAGVLPANGQFILISAAAYARCGGHEAIRGSVIDDVALAAACRRAGVRLGLARGERLASVRMYSSLGGIWEGFSKNAFRFVAADPVGGARTIAASVAATMLPRLAWRAYRLGGPMRIWAAAASYTLSLRGLLYWQRLFRAGSATALLHPLAALVFQGIALNSALRVILRRGVSWKGRTYR